jgi:hypothetical protein
LELRADREHRTHSNYVRLHLRHLLVSDTPTAVRLAQQAVDRRRMPMVDLPLLFLPIGAVVGRFTGHVSRWRVRCPPNATTELQHASEIQLKRIAQIQADLDDLKRALTKTRVPA